MGKTIKYHPPTTFKPRDKIYQEVVRLIEDTDMPVGALPKYILPDWDDLVDPFYDFEKEQHSEQYKQDRFKHGARLWELLGEEVIDGELLGDCYAQIRHFASFSPHHGGIEILGLKNYLRFAKNI